MRAGLEGGTVVTPTVGLWHDTKHRYFAKYADTEPIGPLPGVTGVIGVMDKPAVAYWRGTTVAKIIARDVDFYAKLIQTGGEDAAVAWAGKLPGYEADKAADTGSLVHILVEKILRRHEVEIPVELAPYAIAFRRFLDEHSPRVVSVERMVANLKVGYGGTLDLLLDLGDGIELWDVKTWRKRPEAGKDMYAETVMQLAAYGQAEFIGAANDPKRHRMPAIARYGVLHLRPDLYDAGYSLIPFAVTQADYDAFRGLLAAYRWKQTRAALVIGEPLPHPVKEAVA